MDDKAVRQQLVNMLTVRQAHMNFDDAVKDFPEEHINTKPNGLDYSFWHLIEHIRFCQWDILDYMVNPNYQAHEFPKDYWRDKSETTDKAGWDKTIAQFNADLQALVDIVNDPKNDLYAQIPHAYEGHNIIREIIIVAQHNGYHIGELGILRQMMGLW